MRIIQFVTEALGDASYLVISGSEAAVIDPQRDVTPFVAAAAAAGATIRFVFETHVHNDYLSGGRELSALGATIVAPAGSGLQFPHRPISDGEEVHVGGARLRAIATPGHTYEHTAYLAIGEDGSVAGAFTGGNVLIAAAGRSDLLGDEHTEDLTRLQWESGQRIAALLPQTAEILPTHGAGSFCSSTGAGLERRAPLAAELGRNPLFSAGNYEEFRQIHLAVAMPVPGYYERMAPLNRSGVHVFGKPPLPARLDPGALISYRDAGVPVIDVRPRLEHAEAHIPRSIGIEESDSLLAYVGWLVPFNTPFALVAQDGRQAARVSTDLLRIGYEGVRGYLPFSDWRAESLPTERIALVTVAEAVEHWQSGRMPVLDVRFSYEQAAEPLEGALRRTIDTLPAWLPEVPDGPVLMVCASGQRAVTAASILQAQGGDALALGDAGATELNALACARPPSASR